jgi:hypothetical protein
MTLERLNILNALSMHLNESSFQSMIKKESWGIFLAHNFKQFNNIQYYNTLSLVGQIVNYWFNIFVNHTHSSLKSHPMRMSMFSYYEKR